MAKVYKSAVRQSLHEMAESLHFGDTFDKKTMRDFDRFCLTEIAAVAPDEIRAIRDREEVSQTVFARHLNVTPGLISQWERGEKKPSGPSLKLLDLVARKGLDALI